MGKKYSLNIFLTWLIFSLLFSCVKENTPIEPVSDIEGNIYNTVIIGNQIWMSENLKTTRYNDGTEIPYVTESEDWHELTTPGYCWYDNNLTLYKDSYGALYNGHTVNTGKLCPTGWHVPGQEEWQILRQFLNDSITGGGKLKETGTTHWNAPNKGADNSTGFSARAAGFRYFEGSFSSILYSSYMWSSTEISSYDEWYLNLYYGDAIVKVNHISKKHGLSVRCIKD